MKMGEKRERHEAPEEKKTVFEKCFCIGMNIVFAVFFAVVIFD